MCLLISLVAAYPGTYVPAFGYDSISVSGSVYKGTGSAPAGYNNIVTTPVSGWLWMLPIANSPGSVVVTYNFNNLVSGQNYTLTVDGVLNLGVAGMSVTVDWNGSNVRTYTGVMNPVYMRHLSNNQWPVTATGSDTVTYTYTSPGSSTQYVTYLFNVYVW